MKKLFKLFLMGMLIPLLSLFSCSDDFLDAPSENQLTPADLPEGVTAFDGIAESLYFKPWFTFNDKFLIAVGDMYAGNAFSFDGAYAQFKDAQVTSQNPILAEGYVSLFSVVDQSNNLMKLVEDRKSELPEASYKNAIAISRFMRANAYFYLVRTFGAVPIISKAGSAKQPKRNLISDIYKFIKQDLEYAVQNLPERSVKKGYVTKYAAMGILAKVHLTLNEYTESAALTQQIIGNQYTLIQDYGNLFSSPENNNSAESMFALQWKAIATEWGTQNTNQAYIVPGDTGITGGGDGWGVYLPSISLQDGFEPKDTRKKNTIMTDGDFYPELLKNQGGFTYKKILSSTGANFRKYIVGSAAERNDVFFMRTSQNTIILRYSDILLMNSEAILAGANSTTSPAALSSFNEVRLRAGLPVKTVLTRDELFNERRIEFALEGQYFFDLKRRGLAEATAIISQQEVGFYSDPARTELVSRKITPGTTYFELPLPQSAIDTNPSLLETPVPFNFN
ncbi:RagB/SusD family nutrient uptake outer membrane protein [Flavobacterium sp. LC2016-12]|uniref:RagB/SusD family nutrient uptake outer membrane protein n=1 Tax=Flavobacterium sp. LC2016-12 TaxID=2783794 RepID=UPI00188BCC09|nr:RagB/SusD family nutrient uptake outer membrane protein [Flavobacterium sp. LC2016-12]MBF4466326.1 RagB/SusD family nutrient uptake outer membrane protein [Flavobacterium sp. LC2016-12]